MLSAIEKDDGCVFVVMVNVVGRSEENGGASLWADALVEDSVAVGVSLHFFAAQSAVPGKSTRWVRRQILEG